MKKYLSNISALLLLTNLSTSHATLVFDAQGDFLNSGAFMDISQLETTATSVDLIVDVVFYNSLDGYIPRGLMAMDVDNNTSTGSSINFSEFVPGLTNIGADFVVDFSFRQPFGQAAIYQTEGFMHGDIWDSLDSGNWNLLSSPIPIVQNEFSLSMNFDNTLINDDGEMDFIYLSSAAGFPNLNPQDLAHTQVTIPEPTSILLFIIGSMGLARSLTRNNSQNR